MLTPENFTRIKNDTNGNPRYVCHFLNLIKNDDFQWSTKNKDGTTTTAEDVARIVYSSDLLSLKYKKALERAKKLGGKKFHNKQYGGGIAFQTYSIEQLCNSINTLLSNS